MVKYLKLIFWNLFIVIFVLFIAETILRNVENLKFNSSSNGLLVKHTQKESYFNAKNFTGYSFGEKVFTDNYGYRVPSRDYKYPKIFDDKIIFLGDSVTFGAGVKEEDTFVGILRKNNPRKHIINTAVNGYNFADYLGISKIILNEHEFDLGILVICLNDIISFSNTRSDAKKESELVKLIENSRKSKILLNINNFLRERSKLYLFIKGIVTDPSYRYFKIDAGNYKKNIDSRLHILSNVINEFKSANIPLVILISPYEYQLRNEHNFLSKDEFDNEIYFPQILLKQYLSKNNVIFYDTYDYFKKSMKDSKKNIFISFDPMHLSKFGNEMMYKYIMSEIIR